MHNNLSGPDGSSYIGDYIDGMMNGMGIFTFSNGSSYEGQYKNDKKNGRGIYIDKDGLAREGIWENGAIKKWLDEE